ncbi:unknown [Clostridium sp. CAG:302]|nr:unknown [Clostridium sp. CAG:302]
MTSAEGLVLPQSVGGSLNLSGLTSANGLVLPYDFNLNKLICPSYIKNEILQNPDKYFRKPPSEEENISVHHKR